MKYFGLKYVQYYGSHYLSIEDKIEATTVTKGTANLERILAAKICKNYAKILCPYLHREVFAPDMRYVWKRFLLQSSTAPAERQVHRNIISILKWFTVFI